jgi:hypothetical protein
MMLYCVLKVKPFVMGSSMYDHYWLAGHFIDRQHKAYTITTVTRNTDNSTLWQVLNKSQELLKEN